MADITKELQDKVGHAFTKREPLKIIAGGSKSFLGRHTMGTELSLAEHSGIISYQPVELVMTARAGTTIVELQAALAEHNQELAFDPPCFSDASTLGGTLACNQSGPSRAWSGSVRDHVLGVHLINGRAQLLKFGGQVMKNVAGYDVSRLQAGAMGTLGVITQVSLKVMPKAERVQTLVWDMQAAQAIDRMNKLCLSAKPISAACWHNNRLYVRLSGTHSAVEATIKTWQGEVDDQGDIFWQQLRDQQIPNLSNDQPLWRFSVNSSAHIASLDEHSIIDWGGAQRWYQGAADQQAMEHLAEQAGGQVSLFAGGDRNSEVSHTMPNAMQQLQIRIKKSFDPEAILNPGRLYSWM